MIVFREATRDLAIGLVSWINAFDAHEQTDIDATERRLPKLFGLYWDARAKARIAVRGGWSDD